MKRIAAIILIVTVLVSGLAFVRLAQGITVRGTLTGDIHWTTTDSPVTLNATVIVNNNANLTIDPGVTVNLGMYGLYVSGTLTAIGTSSNQITFMASAIYNYTTNIYAPISFGPTSPPWNDATNSGSIIQNAILNQVDLQVNSASPKIDNCILNFQSPYSSPITISGGSPTISNNTIAYSAQGSTNNVNSIIIYSGTPLITNNLFQGNYYSAPSNDIKVSAGSPTITNNVFEGTYSSANNDGITVNSGTPLITNNKFQGNGFLNAIVAFSPTSFTISHNTFTNCLSGVQADSASAVTVDGNSFLEGTDGLDIATGASVTITGNLINHNSRFGILGGGNIDSNTITNNQVGIHNPPSGTISNNNIVGNTANSITATIANITAENNWWGTTDAPTINQTIYDQKVDQNLGTVTFVPFLTKPSQTAPTIPNSTPTISAIPTQVPTLILTDPTATPTQTPFQYAQSFIYQASTILNLNMILTTTAIILIVLWAIVILGYSAKKGISKHRSAKAKIKKVNTEDHF